MPTKPRPWPNNAAQARDEVIMDLVDIIKMLQPLVYGERFTATEVLRRQARALDQARSAHTTLEGSKSLGAGG